MTSNKQRQVARDRRIKAMAREIARREALLEYAYQYKGESVGSVSVNKPVKGVRIA